MKMKESGQRKKRNGNKKQPECEEHTRKHSVESQECVLVPAKIGNVKIRKKRSEEKIRMQTKIKMLKKE